jgi:hypothetical protein
LARAKEFDVDLAGLAKRVAHSLERERGRVAIAAEMSKNDSIDFSGKQFFDYGGSGVIGKMPVPRLDPLFHWPRPMGVALQKFFVVVGLDYERMHFPKPFHDHLRGVTQVGDKPEAARSGIKRETNGIDRVVWHRKSLDKDVADLELGAGAKNPPVSMSI